MLLRPLLRPRNTHLFCPLECTSFNELQQAKLANATRQLQADHEAAVRLCGFCHRSPEAFEANVAAHSILRLQEPWYGGERPVVHLQHTLYCLDIATSGWIILGEARDQSNQWESEQGSSSSINNKTSTFTAIGVSLMISKSCSVTADARLKLCNFKAYTHRMLQGSFCLRMNPVL